MVELVIELCLAREELDFDVLARPFRCVGDETKILYIIPQLLIFDYIPNSTNFLMVY